MKRKREVGGPGRGDREREGLKKYSFRPKVSTNNECKRTSKENLYYYGETEFRQLSKVIFQSIIIYSDFSRQIVY